MVSIAGLGERLAATASCFAPAPATPAGASIPIASPAEIPARRHRFALGRDPYRTACAVWPRAIRRRRARVPWLHPRSGRASCWVGEAVEVRHAARKLPPEPWQTSGAIRVRQRELSPDRRDRRQRIPQLRLPPGTTPVRRCPSPHRQRRRPPRRSAAAHPPPRPLSTGGNRAAPPVPDWEPGRSRKPGSRRFRSRWRHWCGAASRCAGTRRLARKPANRT